MRREDSTNVRKVPSWGADGGNGVVVETESMTNYHYIQTTAFIEDDVDVRLRRDGLGLIVEWEHLSLYFSPEAAIRMLQKMKEVVEKV